MIRISGFVGSLAVPEAEATASVWLGNKVDLVKTVHMRIERWQGWMLAHCPQDVRDNRPLVVLSGNSVLLVSLLPFLVNVSCGARWASSDIISTRILACTGGMVVPMIASRIPTRHTFLRSLESEK